MSAIDPETLVEWLESGNGRPPEERDTQQIALEQLCMILLMSDNVDRCFESCPPRLFIKALCGVLVDETAPDSILEIVARALTYYLDVSSECARQIVAVDRTIEQLCNKLRFDETATESRVSLDLAEQSVKVLESLCAGEPNAVYQHGTLASALEFIVKAVRLSGEQGSQVAIANTGTTRMRVHRDALRSAMNIVARLSGRVEPSDRRVAEYVTSLSTLLNAGAAAKRDGTADTAHSDEDVAAFIAERSLSCFRSLAERFVRRGADALVLLSDSLIEFALDALHRLSDDESLATGANSAASGNNSRTRTRSCQLGSLSQGYLFETTRRMRTESVNVAALAHADTSAQQRGAAEQQREAAAAECAANALGVLLAACRSSDGASRRLLARGDELFSALECGLLAGEDRVAHAATRLCDLLELLVVNCEARTRSSRILPQADTSPAATPSATSSAAKVLQRENEGEANAEETGSECETETDEHEESTTDSQRPLCLTGRVRAPAATGRTSVWTSAQASNAASTRSDDNVAANRRLIDAIRNGEDERVAAALNSSDANANWTDEVGQTLLNWAAAFGTRSTCSLLLRRGADPNRGARSSSLHYAACFGRIVIVRLLVRHGADPALRDEDGRLPVEKARERVAAAAGSQAPPPPARLADTPSHRDVVSFLENAGHYLTPFCSFEHDADNAEAAASSHERDSEKDALLRAFCLRMLPAFSTVYRARVDSEALRGAMLVLVGRAFRGCAHYEPMAREVLLKQELYATEPNILLVNRIVRLFCDAVALDNEPEEEVEDDETAKSMVEEESGGVSLQLDATAKRRLLAIRMLDAVVNVGVNENDTQLGRQLVDHCVRLGALDALRRLAKLGPRSGSASSTGSGASKPQQFTAIDLLTPAGMRRETAARAMRLLDALQSHGASSSTGDRVRADSTASTLRSITERLARGLDGTMDDSALLELAKLLRDDDSLSAFELDSSGVVSCLVRLFADARCSVDVMRRRIAAFVAAFRDPDSEDASKRGAAERLVRKLIECLERVERLPVYRYDAATNVATFQLLTRHVHVRVESAESQHIECAKPRSRNELANKLLKIEPLATTGQLRKFVAKRVARDRDRERDRDRSQLPFVRVLKRASLDQPVSLSRPRGVIAFIGSNGQPAAINTNPIRAGYMGLLQEPSNSLMCVKFIRNASDLLERDASIGLRIEPSDGTAPGWFAIDLGLTLIPTAFTLRIAGVNAFRNALRTAIRLEVHASANGTEWRSLFRFGGSDAEGEDDADGDADDIDVECGPDGDSESWMVQVARATPIRYMRFVFHQSRTDRSQPSAPFTLFGFDAFGDVIAIADTLQFPETTRRLAVDEDLVSVGAVAGVTTPSASRLVRAARRRYATDSRDRKRRCFREAAADSMPTPTPSSASAPVSTTVTSESVSVSVSVSATPSASATWSGVRVTAAGSPSNEASLGGTNPTDSRTRAPADGADLLNRLLERFQTDLADCDGEPLAETGSESRRSAADTGSARHADLLAGLELLRSAFESSLGGSTDASRDRDRGRDRNRLAPLSQADADTDADADNDPTAEERESAPQMRTASENEGDLMPERAELILPFNVEMGIEDEEDDCDAEDDDEEELGEHFTQPQQVISSEQHEQAEGEEEHQLNAAAQRAAEAEDERAARFEELVSALLSADGDELEQHHDPEADADSTPTRRDENSNNDSAANGDCNRESRNTAQPSSERNETNANTNSTRDTSVLRVRRLFAELTDALGETEAQQQQQTGERERSSEHQASSRLRSEREREQPFGTGWLNETATFSSGPDASRFEQRATGRRERDRERDTDRGVNEAECIVIKRQFSSILPPFDPRPGRHNVNQIQDVTLEAPAGDLLSLDRFADADGASDPLAEASSALDAESAASKTDADADRLVLRLRHVCCADSTQPPVVDELLLDDDRATILKCVQQLLIRAVDHRFAQRDPDNLKRSGSSGRFSALDSPLNFSSSMHSAAYHRAVADALRHVFDGQFVLAYAFRDEQRSEECLHNKEAAASTSLLATAVDSGPNLNVEMSANADANVNVSVPWTVDYVERNVGGALAKRSVVEYLVAHADGEFLRRWRLTGARRNVLRTRNSSSLAATYREFVTMYPRYTKREGEDTEIDAALTCDTEMDPDGDSYSYSYSSATLSPASTCDESMTKLPTGATVNELLRLVECIYLLSDASLDSFANTSLIDFLRARPSFKRALDAFRADSASLFDDTDAGDDHDHPDDHDSHATCDGRQSESEAEVDRAAARRRKALRVAGKCVTVAADAFVSEKLSAKLVAQLGETLITSADALPEWLSTLVVDFGALFAFDARALYFNALAFGTARSLIWLQAHRDMLLHAATRTRCAAYADEFGAFAASHAAGVSARRAAVIGVGGGDWHTQRAAALFSAATSGDLPLAQRTVIGRLKHERVRVERSAERILSWALALLRFHADRKAALEIEFLDEAGTGLGPSLEFYSLVSHQLQRSDFALWFTDDDPLLHTSSDTKGSTDGEGENEEESDGESGDDASRAPPGYFVHAPNGLFPACLPNPLSNDQVQPSTDCELSAEGGRRVRFADGQGASRYRAMHRRALSLFELIGMLLAKAIQDGRLVDLPLAHATFKLLVAAARCERERENERLERDLLLEIGECVDFGDFEATQPFKARFLKRLEQTVRKIEQPTKTAEEDEEEDTLDIDELGIEFSYLPSSSVYAFESVTLPNGGEGRPPQLSAGNARCFVHETVRFALIDGIREQLAALARGVSRVFPFSRLAVFAPQELESIACGAREPKWTRAELERFVEPRNGFTRASPAFRMLIAVLARLTARERKAFVRFATGCSALPPGGLANLRPPLTVVRKVLDSEGADPDCAFPSVNTCVHFLKLPDYSNDAVLYERLMAACRVRGFHLN